jgi:hypothetical protein
MFSSRYRSRYARIAALLSFAAVLLVSASSTRADIVTYSINDYPDSQAWLNPNGPAVAHVSGSITVDTGGVPLNTNPLAIPISDIAAANFEIQTPDATYTGTVASGSISLGGLQATASSLFLTPTNPYSWFYLSLATGTSLQYSDGTANAIYDAAVQPFSFLFIASDIPAVPSVPSGAIGGNPMVIATAVPEPASLTLLISALLGLAGTFYLRRRRTRA